MENSFRRIITDKIHLLKQTGDSSSYLCAICNEVFYSKKLLKEHSTKNHVDARFSCSLCNKSYAQMGHLRRHMLIHTGRKEFICQICPKAFLTKRELEVHIRSHTGDKPYECDVCGKSFSLSGNLITHKRIHTGVKKFECNICFKKFTQAGHLATHKVYHTGIKKHVCGICNKGFWFERNLRRHSKIHLKQKINRCVTNKVLKYFSCSSCSERFLKASALSTHLVSHNDISKGTKKNEINCVEFIQTNTKEEPINYNEKNNEVVNSGTQFIKFNEDEKITSNFESVFVKQEIKDEDYEEECGH